jgi:hypothetical protein
MRSRTSRAEAVHDDFPGKCKDVKSNSGATKAAQIRVFVALITDGAWSRGILRGFTTAAHEHDWALLHYHPATNLDRIANEWAPDAAVVGPELGPTSLIKLAPAAIVSVTVDRSADGVLSVCVDDERVAALDHLLAAGLRNVTSFRFDDLPFSITRERAFVEQARAAGAHVAAGWGTAEVTPCRKGEEPVAMTAWLRGLPKPCGVFTCADGWARTVVRGPAHPRGYCLGWCG